MGARNRGGSQPANGDGPLQPANPATGGIGIHVKGLAAIGVDSESEQTPSRCRIGY
jgi:hypothetical protein